MKKDKRLTIQDSGQEMYFDKKNAELMIKREEIIGHVVAAQAVENIVLSEIVPRRELNIVELGAGAYPQRYLKLLDFLWKNQGKLYWIDQSPIMLKHAKKQISNRNIEFVEEEMFSYLKNNRNKFDALILKYSFNYLISDSLENWLKIMHKSLKDKGIVVATMNLYIGTQKIYRHGLGARSLHAFYTINNEPIPKGYKIKHNEVVEAHFLKKAGDTSQNPETFADTKLIYYSSEKTKEAAKKAGFSEIILMSNWTKNQKWIDRFKKYYPASNIEDTKTKSILFLRK